MTGKTTIIKRIQKLLYTVTDSFQYYQSTTLNVILVDLIMFNHFRKNKPVQQVNRK